MSKASDPYIVPKNGFPSAREYRGMVDKIAVSKSKRTGTYCFDAYYTIWTDIENTYYIKQRIAFGTPYLNDLLDAFESVGIQIGEFEIEAMFNVNIDFDLIYDKDGCGHLVYRDDSGEV